MNMRIPRTCIFTECPTNSEELCAFITSKGKIIQTFVLLFLFTDYRYHYCPYLYCIIRLPSCYSHIVVPCATQKGKEREEAERQACEDSTSKTKLKFHELVLWYFFTLVFMQASRNGFGYCRYMCYCRSHGGQNHDIAIFYFSFQFVLFCSQSAKSFSSRVCLWKSYQGCKIVAKGCLYDIVYRGITQK